MRQGRHEGAICPGTMPAQVANEGPRGRMRDRFRPVRRVCQVRRAMRVDWSLRLRPCVLLDELIMCEALVLRENRSATGIEWWLLLRFSS